MLTYGKYFYYIPSTISCKLNEIETNCLPSSNNSIFVPILEPFSTNNVTLEVDGLVNYIMPSNWSIVSVQKITSNGQSSYSDVDVYESLTSGLTAMTPNLLSMRVMFPNRYAQSDPVSLLVLIDTKLPALPIAQLALNLTIPQGNCQILGSAFKQSLSLSCSFPTQTSANLNLMVYHPLFPKTSLALASQTIDVLPAPSGNCRNQMCDSCSNFNGQEYCFACREGQYSAGGYCVDSCPQGSFPYGSSGICQQCYADCRTCFGYSDAQCLSCRNNS